MDHRVATGPGGSILPLLAARPPMACTGRRPASAIGHARRPAPGAPGALGVGSRGADLARARE
ncbi:MAG: hypothetical protein KGJ30_20480, partial [Burkholderiales bacterium]|nr:hypothetical protein [Burkholderiales bacterium]